MVKCYLFTLVVILILLQKLSAQSASWKITFDTLSKPRVLVMTDITNEPDDQESLVRFLVYSNEYTVEGLIATTSVWLPNKTAKNKILELVDAYGKVRDNLLLHKEGFPAKDRLVSVTKEHLPLFGMEGVGKGKNSEGSKLIIDAVDRNDDRPLWISAWGGTSCLAQALWEVRKTRSKEEVKKFTSKIRVYAISDQDDAGRWIRTELPDVFYIVSPTSSTNSSNNEYYKATWPGISGDAMYNMKPKHHFKLVSNPWLEENIIKGHGALGALYPRFMYIMEGDTPSFLGLIDNGLGSSFSPSYGGWGGRYSLAQTYAETRKIWTNTSDSRDAVVAEDGLTYFSDQATIWRWREAYQNDFAARMDWCISDKKHANHNPVIVLNGNEGKSIVRIMATSGDSISLDTKGTYDPDKNNFNFNWFYYREAGTQGWWTVSDIPKIENPQAQKIQLVMPKVTKPFDLHLICEVKDQGIPALFSYRRIVITINPK